MGQIKCFLAVPNGKWERWLRRYVSESGCPGPMGYHDASIYFQTRDDQDLRTDDLPTVDEKRDFPWPTVCCCGYIFKETDVWQLYTMRQYGRIDGSPMTFILNTAPVGAIWRAEWYEDYKGYCGADGKSYVCRTPGGDWMIDGKASNCTMPDDWEHKCWVREGEAPNFTVGKNGKTCSAGAGSIAMRNYHGFLRNGYLTDC